MLSWAVRKREEIAQKSTLKKQINLSSPESISCTVREYRENKFHIINNKLTYFVFFVISCPFYSQYCASSEIYIWAMDVIQGLGSDAKWS